MKQQQVSKTEIKTYRVKHLRHDKETTCKEMFDSGKPSDLEGKRQSKGTYADQSQPNKSTNREFVDKGNKGLSNSEDPMSNNSLTKHNTEILRIDDVN